MRRLSVYSEVGNYDRVVIQELLKEIAQTQQVDINARHRFKGEQTIPVSLRPHSYLWPLLVVVINEADTLTRDAQALGLRTALGRGYVSHHLPGQQKENQAVTNFWCF